MSRVGIDQPALVIGHSFGGGVAIKLARGHVERIRYLVLLNAKGVDEALEMTGRATGIAVRPNGP